MVNHDRTWTTRRRRRQFGGLTRRRRNASGSYSTKTQRQQADYYDLFHMLSFPYYRKKDAQY